MSTRKTAKKSRKRLCNEDVAQLSAPVSDAELKQKLRKVSEFPDKVTDSAIEDPKRRMSIRRPQAEN